MTTVVSQIFGLFGILISLFIYVFRSRRSILLCKFGSDVCWGMHYFLIGAYSGAALNVIAMLREAVFYNKEKKWAASKIWLYIFLALTILSGIISWESYVSLIPVIGSSLIVISFWCTNPFHIRIIAIPAQLLWTVYNIIHCSPLGTISSVISLVSIGIGLYRNMPKKESKQDGEA